MICQVCGTGNELDREFCAKCQSKLLVVSGAAETYDEGTSEEGVSLDEHLLERVSVLEEIVKRSAETLKMLLEALNRQEKNGFVSQTGLLALKDLLERKGLLVEEELLDLWETRVDLHMAAMEKRERFLERKERMLGGFSSISTAFLRNVSARASWPRNAKSAPSAKYGRNASGLTATASFSASSARSVRPASFSRTPV